jgi:hypothetical protein
MLEFVAFIFYNVTHCFVAYVQRLVITLLFENSCQSFKNDFKICYVGRLYKYINSSTFLTESQYF